MVRSSMPPSTAPRPVPDSLRSPARRRFLALAAAAALSLVALEVALRMAFADGEFRGRSVPPLGALTNASQRAWIENEQRLATSGAEDPSVGAFDPELGWTVRANFRGPHGRSATSAWASRGARTYADEAPADSLRLVSFGDSFTWCDEVGDDQTWQVQLEREDARVEALNFGVPGYGTDQALLRFRRQGRRAADIVLIGIMLENIGRNVNRYRPLWYPRSRAASAKPRFVLDGDALRLLPYPFETRTELCAAVLDGSVLERVREHEYWLDRPRAGVLGRLALGRLGLLVRSKLARQPARLWSEAGEPRRVTLALLRQFHAEALASGASEALVLVFPREGDLEQLERDGAAYWQAAFDELRADGVQVLDLAEPLAAARSARPGERLYGGGHLNAAGNAIVAQELYEWLTAKGWIDAR